MDTRTSTSPVALAAIPDGEWELSFTVAPGAGQGSEQAGACGTDDGCGASCASSCVSFA